MKNRGCEMLIFLILLLSCITGCQDYNKVDETIPKEPLAKFEVSTNQAPNTWTGRSTNIDSPNKFDFTKTDAIIVFQYDGDILKHENGLIYIYDESGVIWHTINYYDDSLNSMSEPGGKFRPFNFRTGNFELEMRCTGKSENWYEVIVEEDVSPKVKKYIKANDPLFEFQTWEKYVLNFTWIVFDQERNPILQTPEGKKTDLILSKEMRFVPVEIKGDWIKIRREEISNGNGSTNEVKQSEKNNFGWIRWKKGEEILVDEFNP